MTIFPKYDIDFEQSAAFLTAVSNGFRLQVLAILSAGEIGFGPLSEIVNLSPSALSQHLKKLRAGKLVDTRKDAQKVY